LSDSRVCRR